MDFIYAQRKGSTFGLAIAHLAKQGLRSPFLASAFLLVIGCSKHTASTDLGHKQGSSEIAKVAAKLAQQLAELNDHPPDRVSLLGSTERFVSILRQADVSHCPEDFRTQYVRSLNAWAAYATKLRTEATYLAKHPDEDLGNLQCVRHKRVLCSLVSVQ